MSTKVLARIFIVVIGKSKLYGKLCQRNNKNKLMEIYIYNKDNVKIFMWDPPHTVERENLLYNATRCLFVDIPISYSGRIRRQIVYSIGISHLSAKAL